MPRRKLKIGFVLDDSLDRPDGVQQYVVTVGEWLRSQGHDVHYLVSATARCDLPNVAELANNVGAIFNGNYLRTPLPAPRSLIAALLGEEKFDILHVQMPFSPFLAARVIRAASPQTAVVGTFHIVPRSRVVGVFSKVLATWIRRPLERFDAVMSVSAPAQTFAKQTFGISSEVVPNPVKLATFSGVSPEAKGDSINILFLGRLVPRKGCLQLLQALHKLDLMDGVPDWHATICGQGMLAPVLHQYVREHGLKKRVTFTGFVTESDKPHYYANADITVFPSTGGESFGMVLIEAMGSGRSAVLAGNNPGYRSVLESCPGDVLFDPYDTLGLAQRLYSLIQSKAERQHIASWQGQYAERFDVERIGRQILRTYALALRAHRRTL